MFGMILLWAVLILGAVYLVRALGQPKGSAPAGEAPNRALELLREHYARGEIDKDDFEARKKDLT
jgi:putative membrane protein